MDGVRRLTEPAAVRQAAAGREETGPVAKFMKYVWYVYALVLVLLIGLAVYTLLGGFAHDYMDPAM